MIFLYIYLFSFALLYKTEIGVVKISAFEQTLHMKHFVYLNIQRNPSYQIQLNFKVLYLMLCLTLESELKVIFQSKCSVHLIWEFIKMVFLVSLVIDWMALSKCLPESQVVFGWFVMWTAGKYELELITNTVAAFQCTRT